MISFVASGYDAFQPTHSTRGHYTLSRFANRELTLTLDTDVDGQDCQIIGTIAPPDEHILSVSLLADTLRRDGATSITALLPYLGYARQDKDAYGTSRGIAWAGGLLTQSGISHITTIDVHTAAAQQLCPIPITSISPAPVFAKALRETISLDDLSVIAPDKGATDRAQDLAHALNLPAPLTMVKHHTDGIEHDMPHVPTTRALIVDDILDTGHTLISCCKKLRAQGIDDITIAVTHALFTGDDWRQLWELGVTRLLVGNTIPLSKEIAKNSHIVSCDLSRITNL